ncbi:MAG: hypothetical protein IH861_00765 [Chloroflexi bacterium]|nr:hypothetical protein [Chloroflexota bacterium]
MFWDKNTPRTVPQALQQLNPRETEIRYYLELYPMSDSRPEGGDDWWLKQVGEWGWTVISQDWNFHRRENELVALKQYEIGCFYLWGAEAPKWEIMRCFARGYDRIIEAAITTPRPFIYWVSKTGLLKEQPLP